MFEIIASRIRVALLSFGCILGFLMSSGQMVNYINLGDSAKNMRSIEIVRKGEKVKVISNYSFDINTIYPSIYIGQDTIDYIDLNRQKLRGGIEVLDVWMRKDIDLSYTDVGINQERNYSLLISESEFSNGNFEDARFLGDAAILFSTFRNTISFDGAAIDRSLMLVTINNGHRINLTNLRLTDSSKIVIEGIGMPDTIDLSNNPMLKKEIDLRAIRPYKGIGKSFSYLNLYNTDISKVRLNYFNYRLMVDSLNIEDAKIVYIGLLENFRKHGQDESYQALDIEYHEYKDRHTRIFKYLWFVPYYWNRYGYQKGWVFWWTVIFLVFYTVVTFVKFESLNDDYEGVYPIIYLKKEKSFYSRLHKSGLRSLINRLYNSFLWTALIFFLLKLDIKNIRFEKKLGTLYLFSVYATGILCLAYIAGYILSR